MSTNTHSDKERIDDDLGTLTTGTATVGRAHSAIELPERVDEDAEIKITGHGLDDEPSVVTLQIAGAVSVSLTLDAADALELADEIATAAERVDGWDGSDQ
jgi:hypothetical protein